MIEYSADGKTALYCGYKFRKDSNTGYYLCSTKTDIGKRERLHNFVYRTEYHLPYIPTGYHIHHIDGNKDNNEPGNLQMITSHEHEQYHGNNVSGKRKAQRTKNIIEKAMPAARKWHSSDQGIQWHRQNGIETYKARKEIKYICDCCGNEFETRHIYGNSNKFCSNKCKAAYRRKSGVDNVERSCARCGITFKCNKYSLAKYCDECSYKKH